VEVGLAAARHVGVDEVRERLHALVERGARVGETRLERGDLFLAAAPLGRVRLALFGRQLALAGLLVLVAQPVRLVDLVLQGGDGLLRGDRAVDVDRDTALARALGDLVASLVEAARVEHGRRSKARQGRQAEVAPRRRAERAPEHADERAGSLVAELERDRCHGLARRELLEPAQQTRLRAPGRERERGLALEQALERAHRRAREARPFGERARIAWLGAQRVGDASRARIARQRQVQRRRRRGPDLVRDHGHEPRLGSLDAIGLRERDRAQDRLAQQRRHLHHAARLARERSQRIGEIDRAHRDGTGHADRVAYVGGHPDGALGRHHPGAVLGGHRHHAARGVEQLRERMLVPRDHCARRVLGRDPFERSRERVRHERRRARRVLTLSRHRLAEYAKNVAHGSTKVAA
jgi:hypothetical protein